MKRRAADHQPVKRERKKVKHGSWSSQADCVGCDVDYDTVAHCVLLDASPSLDGTFARLQIISYLSEDDMLAVYETCGMFKQTLRDYFNCDLFVPLPRGPHILRSAGMLEWVLCRGWDVHGMIKIDESLWQLMGVERKMLNDYPRSIQQHIKPLLDVEAGHATWATTIAAAVGSRHVVCTLIQMSCPWDRTLLLLIACFRGDVPMLRMILRRLPSGTASQTSSGKFSKFERLYPLASAAAMYGRTKTLAWLLSHGCDAEELGRDKDADIISAAANAGSYEWLTSLEKQGCVWSTARVLDVACTAGNIDVVRGVFGDRKILCKVSTDFNSILSAACRSGNLDLVKYLHGEFLTVCSGPGAHAMRLQWRKANRSLIIDLATCHHFDVLDWLWDEVWLDVGGFRGCMTEIAVESLASAGNLHALKYLMARQFFSFRRDWSSYITLAAARFGHADVLQWLLESGCPMERLLCLYQAISQSMDLEVLQWLYQFCFFDIEFPFLEALNEAAPDRFPEEDLEGWGLDSDTLRAALRGKIDVLDWLISIGCPCNPANLIRLCKKQRLLPLRGWLKQRNLV